MNWYYALEGQQIGPVTDADLQNLVAAGTIRKDTLVWHQGMPDWAPYSKAGSASASTHAAGAGQAALGHAAAEHTTAGEAGATEPAAELYCSQCGRGFQRAEMIRYGDIWICGDCKPVFMQRLKEGAALPRQMVYGGFWIRFGARFVDGIILLIVNMVVRLPFQMSLMNAGPNTSVSGVLGVFGFLLLLQVAFNIAYETFFIGKYGATPGKMACKLRVVMSDGSPVSYLRAFARYFAYILSGFTLLIGFIIAAFDSEKRALHDHICNTRVVRV